MGFRSTLTFCALAAALFTLAGCGGGRGSPEGVSLASAGQVENASMPGMTRHAAARAADQVSFGATPQLVEAIRAHGLNAWVTGQFATAPSQATTPIEVQRHSPNIGIYNDYPLNIFFNFALKAEDQLRLRVSWALMQFIPVDSTPYANVEYFNMLQRNAFGNFGSFIRELTIDPAMGTYQNNVQNRPKTSACPTCSTNENYARELMQIFTLGVVKLNADGSTVRDGSGRAVPTYSETDVQQLTLALTGWAYSAAKPTPHPDSNWMNAPHPMVMDTAPGAHDARGKTLLGQPIAAGLNASQELDRIVAIIMAHQNVAPFVSLRLIQHLVMSDPSPAYLGRVSAVFRDNGSGITGDMKAVVRAVLMDAEARAGDALGAGPARSGKFREPVLFHTSLYRGLGCESYPLSISDGETKGFVIAPWLQEPFRPPTVFSFYPPSYRTPKSHLLAPEHRLLGPSELSSRITWYGQTYPILTSPINNGPGKANCKVQEFADLLAASPEAFVDRIDTTWLRGAMSATMRRELLGAAARPNESGAIGTRYGALQLILHALGAQQFGVMQ